MGGNSVRSQEFNKLRDLGMRLRVLRTWDMMTSVTTRGTSRKPKPSRFSTFNAFLYTPQIVNLCTPCGVAADGTQMYLKQTMTVLGTDPIPACTMVPALAT